MILLSLAHIGQFMMMLYKNHTIQIPPGKHDLYCADDIDQRSVCPDIDRS